MATRQAETGGHFPGHLQALLFQKRVETAYHYLAVVLENCCHVHGRQKMITWTISGRKEGCYCRFFREGVSEGEIVMVCMKSFDHGIILTKILTYML